MDIPPDVQAAWDERHMLDRAMLHRIHECGDDDDPDPFGTAIAQLRAHAS